MSSVQKIRWRGYDIPVPPLDLTDPELYHRNVFFSRVATYLAFNHISGDYAEFGCASARTFRLAYDALRIGQGLVRTFWAFDTFEGLPATDDARDRHPRWTAGNYPTALDLFDAILETHPIPRSDFRTVPGAYSATIGPHAPQDATLAPHIALAYVDCDMYSSTRDVLHFLAPRLRNGVVVAFDDYFCYSEEGIAGERLALLEFIERNPRWTFVPYERIGWHGQAFIVEDSSLRG